MPRQLCTGSCVLQIIESPVCSLDMVPQACDWLLACVQVTLSIEQAPLFQSKSRHHDVDSVEITPLSLKECALISNCACFLNIFVCVFVWFGRKLIIVISADFDEWP